MKLLMNEAGSGFEVDDQDMCPNTDGKRPYGDNQYGSMKALRVWQYYIVVDEV